MFVTLAEALEHWASNALLITVLSRKVHGPLRVGEISWKDGAITLKAVNDDKL